MEYMKQTISATIDSDLSKWIDQQILNKKYRNKSHLIELALLEFKEIKKIKPFFCLFSEYFRDFFIILIQVIYTSAFLYILD